MYDDIITYIFNFCDYYTSLQLLSISKKFRNYVTLYSTWATKAEINNFCSYETFKNIWLLIEQCKIKTSVTIKTINIVINKLRNMNIIDETTIFFNTILNSLKAADDEFYIKLCISDPIGFYDLLDRIHKYNMKCQYSRLSKNLIRIYCRAKSIPLSHYCNYCIQRKGIMANNKLYKQLDELVFHIEGLGYFFNVGNTLLDHRNNFILRVYKDRSIQIYNTNGGSINQEYIDKMYGNAINYRIIW